MKSRFIAQACLALVFAATLASCGNTIRGVGRDAANMVGATKQAGRDVAKSM